MSDVRNETRKKKVSRPTMDNTIKGSDVGSSTCKMEMDESVSDSVGHGRIEIVRKHSNKVFPFPTTLASNEMKCENEKHNGTSANDNKETEKLQSLEDQHLERGENNTQSQLSKRSSLPSISSKVTDDESCLRVIKRNLCAFPGHCWKVLRCKESLFPKRDVKPRELTPKQATKIIVLRLLMILHTCLSIWRVAVEKNNQLFWIFTLMIPLQILEGVYSLRRDRRIRKRWRPCFVVYFVSVVPSFWILQYERHFRTLEGQENSPNCSESDAGSNGILDAIQGLDSLKISTWSVVLMEMLAYIILIGRLLHDSVTQKVLIQHMIGFLTSASDIFELFSLFEETKVIEDSKATLFVLIFWTFSLLQFIPIWGSHNLGNTETDHRKQKYDDKKHYMFLCSCDDIFDDAREGATETYEAGFAWVFQDGPFLALRVYLIINLNLYTESLIFYTLKNITLTILLIVKFKCSVLWFCIWGFFFTLFIFLFGYINEIQNLK